jgi:hypothetical protein
VITLRYQNQIAADLGVVAQKSDKICDSKYTSPLKLFVYSGLVVVPAAFYLPIKNSSTYSPELSNIPTTVIASVGYG